MFSLCIDDYAHNMNVFVEKFLKISNLSRVFCKNKKKLFQFNYEHYGHYLQTVHDNLKLYSVVWQYQRRVFYSGHVFFVMVIFGRRKKKLKIV